MKGFTGDKNEFVKQLEIDDKKFQQLITVGMIAKEGDTDKYKIV